MSSSAVRGRFLFREVNERGFDLPLGSVTKDGGVEFRADLEISVWNPGDDTSGYKRVQPGDFVIGLRSFQSGIGRSEIETLVSPAYTVLRPIDERVHVPYFKHLFKSDRYISRLENVAQGIRQGRTIATEDFYNIECDVPPLAEQRAIADYLDAETARIDALIAKKQQLIHLLEERRRDLLSSAVAGNDVHAERRSSAVPWVQSLPAHWNEASLKLVAQLGSGHTPSRNHPEWWVPDDCVIPWVTTGEVSQMRTDRLEYLETTRERISPLGMANSSARLHPKNSVVLCRTASAGYSSILGEDMATSQDIVVWTCGPLLEPRFLLLCLRAMRSDLLDRLAMGSTHKTIYMPDVETIRVPLPRLDEQSEIVDQVWEKWRAIDEASEKLSVQTKLLAERRQALITAAVTGNYLVPGDS